MDRKVLLALLLLVPALFAQGDKYVTWSEIPKLFAVIGFVSTFVSGLLSFNILGAIVGGLIAAILNYIVVLIALKIMGR